MYMEPWEATKRGSKNMCLSYRKRSNHVKITGHASMQISYYLALHVNTFALVLHIEGSRELIDVPDEKYASPS